jgi:uncharacterized membrane protein
MWKEYAEQLRSSCVLIFTFSRKNMQQIENQLQLIAARLAKIESALNIAPQAPSVECSEPPPVLQPVQAASQPHQTELKSGNWLGAIAIICFVLAAGFIIKLSIATGWLTPEKQIGLACLLGLGLTGAGFAMQRSDRAYASFLPAAGVIVFYLATFAAHQYYSLISFNAAIAATSIVSAFCVWLYWKIKHDIYTITAASGAYLAPLILGLNTTAIFSVYYFIPCSLAFATISIWVRSRTLAIIAAYLAVLANAWIGFDLDQDALIAIILPLHFLIFSVGNYFYTQKAHQQLTQVEAWSFFPALLIFYAIEYYFIDRMYPNLAPWISLGFAGFLIGLYLWTKKLFHQQSLDSQAMILAFATLVFFHSVYLELLPSSLQPWLFVAIILGRALLPDKFYRQKDFKPYAVPVIALFTIAAIEYTSMIFYLATDDSFSWSIVSLAALGSIWLLCILQRESISKKNEYAYMVLSAAHFLAIMSFYQLTNSYGSLAVSASWLLYAIFVITFAFIRKDKVMANSALIVLSFAAVKTLLYDASSAPTVIRISCLLVTGAVLYGAGFLMRKIATFR